MRESAKVIISRKGFDSSAGGSYSPFDPQTGAYMVLPIPMDDKERRISNNLRYKDVKIQRNYLSGIQADNLQELMRALEVSPSLKGEHPEHAHLDPWLGPCPWLTEESDHYIGAFGQVDRSQSHLHNRKVGEGSLFLFFSRFTALSNRENLIVPSFDREQLSEGLYFIYGWLRVGNVVQQYEDIHDSQLLSRHPHAHRRYFQAWEHAKKGKNTIYVADRYLFEDCSRLPGCGYFPRLNRHLLLTATPSCQEPHDWLPTRWRLPSFFSETPPTYLGAKPWSVCDDGSVVVHARGQWQEAVCDWSPGFHDWFSRLLIQGLDDRSHLCPQV